MRSPAALTLKDAVRIITGKDDSLVELLDRILGGTLIAASALTASPAPLALLEPKNELIAAIKTKGAALTSSLKGASIPERTRTIQAAHAVLVVVSFLEALDSTLDKVVDGLLLTRGDLLAFATGEAGSTRINKTTLVVALASADIPCPSPQLPFEAVLNDLVGYYDRLASQLAHFMTGLAVWDKLDETQQGVAARLITGELPQQAVRVYERDFVTLAVEAPELAIWSNLQDHMATRKIASDGLADVTEKIATIEHSLATGLQGMRETLARFSEQIASAKSRWHYSLSQAYQYELHRPLLGAEDEQLAGISSPSVSEGYVEHQFRVAEYDGSACRPETEAWWSEYDVRDDLDNFLSAYLTSPGAPVNPLLLLGHPGAGKSTLSRVLVGQLPSAGFLPIRVTLREVPADASIRGQIDDALFEILGERVSWGELVESSKTAMPVVILDGFDELLQATGVTRSDYLEQVAQFQEAERSQGRAVAVIVTSRTAVADRARIPLGTLILKLEPFSEQQIIRWIKVWNESNSATFQQRRIQKLRPETVLAHRELSTQPILLLMLAVYDAAENSLQREDLDLPQATLYERLLTVFARRQVMKDSANLDAVDLDRRVARELDNLSVVALAMFNRDRQVIREQELDNDFEALGQGGREAAREGFYGSLTPTQRILGRFFFIHRSEASDGVAGERLASAGTLGRSFEFLHATFGEYLVARLLLQLVARAKTTTPADPWAPADRAVDDGLLSRLYCYQAITKRKQIVLFVKEIAAGLHVGEKQELRSTLRLLLGRDEILPLGEHYPRYAPGNLDQPSKMANYSATLIVLLLALGESVELYGKEASPGELSTRWWRAQTLLWRSRLDEEAWRGLVETLRMQKEQDRIQLTWTPAVGAIDSTFVERAALRYHSGRGLKSDMRFVLLHNEVPRSLAEARLSMDGTVSRALAIIEDLNEAFGSAATMFAMEGREELLSSTEFDTAPSFYVAQALLRGAFPPMDGDPTTILAYLRFVVDAALGRFVPNTPSTDARALAWQVLRISRMQPFARALSADLRIRILESAIAAGPKDADFGYYSECLRAGAEWLDRDTDDIGDLPGGDEGGFRDPVEDENDFTRLLSEARSAFERLDLVEPVDGPEKARVLDLILDVEERGCGMRQLAPQLGTIEDWLDRLGLFDLVYSSPRSIARVLRFARRRRLAEWAGTRAPGLIEALKASGHSTAPLDVLFAVESGVANGEIDASGAPDFLREHLPPDWTRQEGEQLLNLDAESWEDAKLARVTLRHLRSW